MRARAWVTSPYGRRGHRQRLAQGADFLKRCLLQEFPGCRFARCLTGLVPSARRHPAPQTVPDEKDIAELGSVAHASADRGSRMMTASGAAG
jgi:hypothetical protein